VIIYAAISLILSPVPCREQECVYLRCNWHASCYLLGLWFGIWGEVWPTRCMYHVDREHGQRVLPLAGLADISMVEGLVFLVFVLAMTGQFFSGLAKLTSDEIGRDQIGTFKLEMNISCHAYTSVRISHPQ
jgi:hypothetical protein